MRNSLFLLLCAVAALLSLPSFAAQNDVRPVVQVRSGGFDSGAWKIERQWDRQAELEFSAWVKAIGEAREKKSFRLINGLKDPTVNPLFTESDKDLNVLLDCANLPYAMRAYFTYKTGRPMSFVANKGHRYKAGNRPREFKDFSQFKDFPTFLDGLLSAVSSSAYRMDASLEGTDTYPIDVTIDSLVPGTVYYDPNGHVLIVYKVDNINGDIYLLDGHPDGTFTRKVWNPSYAVGSARFGGGFRSWRQFRVELLDNEKGSFRIERLLNKDSYAYSGTAQYQGKFPYDQFELTYHEWVRARISKNGLYVFPVEDLTNSISGFCAFIQERIGSVDEALTFGMHEKPHPVDLPPNIYGAEGLWEEYATPGRDARLRYSVFALRDLVVKSVTMAYEKNARLRYQGAPLQLYADLVRIWNASLVDPQCQFTYTNSAGGKVTLTLTDLMARVYDLSFDPYHCPEMRWGAPLVDVEGKPTEEISTCPQDKRKWYWYREERRLRNRMTRLLDRNTATHRGPENPEDISLASLFACYDQNRADLRVCHTKVELKPLVPVKPKR